MGLMGPAFTMALEILITILLIYCIYKIIWYICKLCALNHTIMKLRKKGFTVVRLRGGFGRAFGARGAVDYRIITPAAVFEVSVISFISNHSRWNIETEYIMETNEERYRIDVRRYNNMFYKVERHGERPEHALDFNRESRITLTRLVLPPRDENIRPQDRRILLFYPKPKLLTRTTNGMNYLNSGDKLEDFEVMYLDRLLDELDKAKNSSNGD